MSCLCTGSGVSESENASPLRAISQLPIALRVSECEPWWLSNIDVLGAHLSVARLKSGRALCGVQTLCFSRRSSGFLVPS